MPSDLLMPAFAITLAANAILILVALRAMLSHDDAAEPTTRPIPPNPGTSPAPPAIAEAPEPTATATATDSGPVAGETASAAPSVPSDPVAADPPTKPTKPKASSTAKPKRPPASRAKGVAATAAIAAGTTKGPPDSPDGVGAAGVVAVTAKRRRRFSLPPDDDHEKVNRSIETFLAGGGAATGTEADAAPAPTTVALVTVVAGRGSRTPATREVEAVERELRAAARGTDRVEVVRTGHWRVVLNSTGELAARAYLRSVRATVEPVLDELDPACRLVAATATVLDQPIEEATAIAERRLATLLRADDEASGEPRAAGD